MIKSRLKTLKFATLGFLVLLLALFPASPVLAVDLGHYFNGTVKYTDETPVEAGKVISAQVAGTEYGSCTISTAGQYELIVQGGINGIEEGAIIYFYVDGQEAGQTFPFHDGWSTTEHNLTVPAPLPVQYALTVSSTAGGTVTTPGEGTFPGKDAGLGVGLVAEADTGYYFAEWTGDVGTVTNIYSPNTAITMNGDYEIVATFEATTPYQFGLTISSTPGGSVIIPGEGTINYDAGAVINLVASQFSGYYFINWTGDVGTMGSVNSPSTTIIMNGHYSIQANFGALGPSPPPQYNLAISSTSGGSVTTPGEGSFTYIEGSTVSLVASPIAGYQFVNWTGNVVANANDPTTSIIMNGHYVIQANFEMIPVTYYTLTIAVNGNGSTSPAVGQHNYAAGTVVPITATPSPDNQFVNWTGDVLGDVNDPTITVTMNGNYSIQANFEVIPPTYYTLTLAVSGNGTTDPSVGEHTYTAGTLVDLAASSYTGYQFVNWTGGVASPNSATTTVTMDSDKTITANFEAEALPAEETDWPLIGGISAGGIAALFIIFFLARRRRREARG